MPELLATQCCNYYTFGVIIQVWAAGKCKCNLSLQTLFQILEGPPSQLLLITSGVQVFCLLRAEVQRGQL